MKIKAIALSVALGVTMIAGVTSTTPQGTVVYLKSDHTLTTTASGNTKFGVVQFYRGEKSVTDTAVTFGVNLG